MITALTLMTIATAGPPSADTLGGRFLERRYEGEAGSRLYRLFVPDRAGAAPAPLVLMLHGCTQDAADFARGTRMNELAAAHGFLVAYPEQPATAQPLKCWSWYEPAHQRRDAGEPAVLVGIVREVMREHGIDPARVYVAGVSAGGAMALTLAGAYPDLFAAAGVHSAVPYGVATSASTALQAMRGELPAGDALAAPLLAAAAAAEVPPLIAFHGAADPTVHAANAAGVAEQWLALLRARGRPADVGREECGDAGGLTYTRRVWGGGALELWTVEGLAHAWSGGSADGSYTDPRGPDASREMVRFLLAHPRR